MRRTGEEAYVMLENYLEKVYSGIVGMKIGIRLCAPIEPAVWT